LGTVSYDRKHLFHGVFEWLGKIPGNMGCTVSVKSAVRLRVSFLVDVTFKEELEINTDVWFPLDLTNDSRHNARGDISNVLLLEFLNLRATWGELGYGPGHFARVVVFAFGKGPFGINGVASIPVSG
jgi:hypothetical protein